MKLNSQNSSISSKRRIFLVIIFIVVSMGVSGFITYQILDLKNDGQEMAKFKAKLNKIVETKDKEVVLEKELEELTVNNSNAVLFTYDNYDDDNPFKSLLKKKQKAKPEPKPEPEVESKPESKEKEDAKKAEEEKEKIKRPDFQFMGTVDSRSEKRAIIKLNGLDSQVYVVAEGERLKGFIVKQITSGEIIIEKEGKVFLYNCGGEFCESQ
jgi:hypothetical protein